MPISDLRRQYTHQDMDDCRINRDPIAQFRKWLEEAIEADLIDATAMTLATATRDGKVSARVMLLKGIDENGFVFYSNYKSRKGQELASNPQAAMVFYWSRFDRQVRVEGRVERTSREKSEAYFHSRPRESQVSALASRQSRAIECRRALERQVEELTRQHEGAEIPLPDDWGGYVLVPQAIEFWQGRTNRLHERLRFTRQNEGAWHTERLSP